MKKKTLITISCFMFLCTVKTIAQNWTVDGNTTGAPASFGTIDAQRIDFISNNIVRGKLSSSGLWSFGNTTPLAQVHINSKSSARNPLQVDILDTAKMIVYSNGGVAVGNVDVPPANGLFVSGKLGIGTNTPHVKLHVTGGTNVNLSDGGTIVAGPVNTFNLAIDNTEIQTRNNGAAANLSINKYGGNVNIGSGGLFFQSITNRLGIGTTEPAVPLNVVGGFALSLNGGGTIVTGPTNSYNLGISTGAIQARNNGGGSLLSLNSDGGDVNISRGALVVESDNNFVGIGATPSAKFHVVLGTEATLTDGGYIVAGPTTFQNIVIDADEIQARNNGNAATLNLNPAGDALTKIGGDLEVDGEEIRFLPNNPRIRVTNTGNLSLNSDFIPEFDQAGALGNSINRWEEVWSADGSINTSDARDKTNIKDLNYGLKEIMKLHSVRFNWKDKIENGDKLGLIAQDLQKVLPEVVKDYEYKKDSTGKTEKIPAAHLGVMYADIIPVIIKGMQQQQEMINEQNKKIESLTQLIDQLTNNNQKADNTRTENQSKSEAVISDASLAQNAPNPFHQNTIINYYLPQNTGNAFIKITDMNGRILKTISINAKGNGQVVLHAGELTAGTYQYSLIINGKLIDTKKMELLK